MSSSNWQFVHLRIFVVAITLAMVCSIVFYTYHKDELSPTDLSMITETPTVNYEKPQAEKDIIILVWMWPWGHDFFNLTCAPYNITGCFVTINKTMYSEADAVMFHHYDIHSDLAPMPKEQRPSFQKWIWWTMEPPSRSPMKQDIDNLFNLTCNYRRDSDIFTPYGNLLEVSKEDGLFTRVPLKERLVCWIVSYINPNLKRIPYYNELKKHIKIDTYGPAFGPRISEEKYVEIVKSCKFYLSFENHVHKDYITEKFFRPLELGTVPVVLGPPRDDYEMHAPGSSFIHVDDFPSPKELAERLKYLDQHPDEYMDYFEWRNSLKSVNGRFGQDNVCMTCQYLKTYKRYQHFRNLNKWFWQ